MELQMQKMRKKNGMTQGELAERIGCSLRKISAWERNETSLPLEDACKIADVFDCSLDELAGRWEYVGRLGDERQRRLNRAYAYLDDSQRSIAVGAVEGIAAQAAQEKTEREGPLPSADTA